ncbi:hypothetical protein GCM10022243_43920 [Saccharothrix violaceirubra]|uniref:RHS repeat-associated protein n=1 Tax=Saccharothrix violaceirubra TaxID=413306 RepID=A0A7W7T3M4_9PSEU|nr:RHS repeat-associated core domain-containing protein [Saccharothrix violaceirubra]MBB4965681.1 RHS repeat-associated protein [Saccharothrix violaceirubra]
MGEQRFHRDMKGDRLPGGATRSVTVADSQGNERDDEDWLAGYSYEQTSFDGETGPALGKSLSWPAWRGPTATRGVLKSYWIGTAKNESYTALDNGRGWRIGRTTNEFDDLGLPTVADRRADVAEVSTARCTRTTYVRNTTSGLALLPSRVETVAKPCDQQAVYPDDLISDLRTHYDGQAFGVAPTKGDVTRTDQVKAHETGSDPVYVTTSTATYDQYGRPLTVADALNRVTKTAYTPTTGGPVTKVTTTNPANHVSNTEFEPAWGVPVKTTDVNLRVTESVYDALGRLTDGWAANRTRAQTPSVNYTYLIRADGPIAVTTKAIGPNGVSTSSVQLYDGLLRPRQSQAPAAGGGRLITDIRYDTHGRAWKASDPFYNSGALDTELWDAADNAVPATTTTEYDQAGRATASVFRVNGAEKWRTTTGYGGDRVYTTPPAGGTPTTVITNALGLTSQLWQHSGPTPTGAHDTTTYTYTTTGQPKTVTDPAGNTWTKYYDLRGRVVRVDDPDTGTTTATFDDAGQRLTSTDSLGRTLVRDYDSLGRVKTLHSGSLTGQLRVKWDYDTAYKGVGMLASSTRYDGTGNAYVTKVPNYNQLYQPGALEITIPASEGKLAGTYITVFGYNPDGSLAGEALPKAGVLDSETVLHTYDDFGRPMQTNGGDSNTTVFLASQTDYTRYGEIQRMTLGSAVGKRAWISNYFEDGTRRLKESIVDAELANPMQAKVGYTYDAVGRITAITDAPTGQVPDNQCFTYDHLNRLTEAWTPGNGVCSTAPTKTGLAGPAPYWHTYAYDVTGNRTSEVRHGVGTAADETKTYTYPMPGTAHPHALQSATTVTSGGSQLDTYQYDAAGNTKQRNLAGTASTFDWDPEGHLASYTQGPSVTSFVYDADGARLLRKDPTATTLYIGSQELKLTKSTNTVSVVRYYKHADQVVAQRTGKGAANLTYLAGDHHGTAQIAIRADTLQTTKRRHLPFGGDRGTVPSWVNERGFVGGTKDTTTGLTHLGAREYDPSTGRFISVDPILDPGDPQQMNGYAYANNNPTTLSDPSGLIVNCGPDNVACGGIKGDPNPPTQEEQHNWWDDLNSGPATGGSNGSDVTTITIVSATCGPTQTRFVNPNNNANLAGYLQTIATVHYTGILHEPACVGPSLDGSCGHGARDVAVEWTDGTVVSQTPYKCGERDQTPGCGPFISQGGPSTAESWATLGKLFFDPTQCFGANSSVIGCTIEAVSLIPVGKVATTVGKVAAKAGSEVVQASSDLNRVHNIAKNRRGGDLQPDPNAGGSSHTVIEWGADGRVDRYQTWIEEPRSPIGWQKGPRFRGVPDGTDHAGMLPPLYYPTGGGKALEAWDAPNGAIPRGYSTRRP